MLTPRTIVDAKGGLARGVDITAFGHTRRDLAASVLVGEIERIRPGVFASGAASTHARAAAAHGGALTCANALSERGVWVLEADEHPHVWLGPGGRTHEHPSCACVEHFRSGRMRLGVVEVELALVHAYGCHGAEFFFAAFESAWRQRLIGAAARARIRAALPATAQWLVDFARADADSGLESVVRLRLHLLGISVLTQVSLPGVGRVDFVIDGRVILEADGRDNHAGGPNRHRDLHRDAVASNLGYETLRFDYALIIHDWPTVSAAILAALARARG
jgi:very-short-patch-repair endonuclease